MKGILDHIVPRRWILACCLKDIHMAYSGSRSLTHALWGKTKANVSFMVAMSALGFSSSPHRSRLHQRVSDRL